MPCFLWLFFWCLGIKMKHTLKWAVCLSTSSEDSRRIYTEIIFPFNDFNIISAWCVYPTLLLISLCLSSSPHLYWTICVSYFMKQLRWCMFSWKVPYSVFLSTTQFVPVCKVSVSSQLWSPFNSTVYAHLAFIKKTCQEFVYFIGSILK